MKDNFKSCFIFLFISFGTFINAQTTLPFTSPGTTTWTVPACVTSITVQAWAGGGGGGAVWSQFTVASSGPTSYEICTCAGGGGGGGFVQRVYAVTPGQVYTITVGAGGNGGTVNASGVNRANNGSVGGNSVFSGPATVGPGALTAIGGSGGGAANISESCLGGCSGAVHQGSNGTGGTGGSGTGGTTTFSGGAGATGVHSGSTNDRSGAGGGGAGTSAIGGNATGTTTGGIGGATGGGNGANGIVQPYGNSYFGTNGLVGNTLGGGGGGASGHNRHSNNTAHESNIGGNGARGEIQISYISASPGITSVSSPTLTCLSNNVQSVITFTNGATTFSWSGPGVVSGGNTASVTVNQGGVYNYTASVSGCPSTGSITVGSNTNPPAATASLATAITCTSTSATLQGGPLSGVTYSWTGAGLTGATNQATAAITAPGTYTLVTTSTVNGCTNTAVVTPTANLTPPNASVNPDVTINCVTPTATVSGSSSTPGVTYAWTGPTVGNPAGSTPTNSTSVVNAAGNYTLTVTNPVNGCTATAVQAVTSNVTIPTITVGSSQTVTCLSPSAVLTGSSSASPVNYSWTGPAVGNPAGSTPTNSTTTINAGGTYTLVVTNPLNSCTNTAVVSITQNTTAPSITATNTSTLTCTTLTANVSGTGGGTYAWSGPGITSGATSSNATVNQPGTYNLTVTAANGCTATASTSITQNTTAPTATLTPSSLTTTCASPTASLLVTSSADPNSIYTWTAPISGSLNNINSNNPVASGSGIFTVAVTNTINGCVSAIQTVTITSDVNTPVLNAISSNSIICSGEPTTLSVTGADSYTWSSGAGSVNTSTAIVSPTVTTTYSVIGTNTLTGCSNVTSITITANATPTIGVSSNVNAICLGNNSIINLTGASSYTITNPLLVVTNSIVVTPTIQTTYTVVGSISNCVSASQTITIDVNSLPTLNATASNSTICSNQTTTLSITGADTYTWSTLETATTITVSPSTTTTYSVSGTNTLTGCSNITNVTVNVTPTPTVNVSASAITICEGNTTTLTLTGATNYTVTNPSQTTTGTIVLTPTVQTTYTIVGESSNCASTTQTITIDVNALPILATSNATTCAGVVTTLSASGADTYNWSTTANTNTTSVSPTTNTTYTVTGTNTVTGCTSTVTTVDVTVNQLPNITASANPNTTCTNGTVNLNAATTGTTAITNYTWTLGNGVDNTNQNQGSITFQASTLTTGTYTYTVVATDANGCVSLQATTSLDIIDTPNANFDLSDLSICQNENGTISINTPQTGVTYDWNINGQAVTNTNPLTVPSIITSAAGTYTVNVIAGIGTCTNTAANTLTVNALPTVTLVNSITSACVNTTAQLDVAGPNSTYTYNWTNGSNTATGPNLNVNPLTQATAGSYTVTATDQNGCVNRTIGAIDAQECITEVPEIFTPNGDGKNDGFVIKNIENFPDNKLKIFNRWGNLVYQKDGYLNEFEGFANTGDQVGKSKLPSGTYYVILDYGDEKTETYNGILVLQY